MAILKSPFQIVGSLGNLSYYTRADSDQIIVRQKGGPSRKKIMTSDRFSNTRLNMSEFGGRAKASQFLLRVLRPLTIVTREKVFNALHRPLKAIQELDTTNRKGQRHICLSRAPMLLEGFSLDKKHAFESIISTPLGSAVLTDKAIAQITIPALIPNVNLHLGDRFPFYRIIFSFAAVPDFIHTERGYTSGIDALDQPRPVYESTEWLPAKVRFPGKQLPIALPAQDGPDNKAPFVFMLSAAVQMGMPSATGVTEPVKYQGAGKILRVVGDRKV